MPTHEDPDKKERAGTAPPERRGYPIEPPFYEETFDPYFVDAIESLPTDPNQSDERPPDVPVPEEDWYWREPESMWLQEDMWPWPQPNVRTRPREDPPNDIEP